MPFPGHKERNVEVVSQTENSIPQDQLKGDRKWICSSENSDIKSTQSCMDLHQSPANDSSKSTNTSETKPCKEKNRHLRNFLPFHRYAKHGRSPDKFKEKSKKSDLDDGKEKTISSSMVCQDEIDIKEKNDKTTFVQGSISKTQFKHKIHDKEIQSNDDIVITESKKINNLNNECNSKSLVHSRIANFDSHVNKTTHDNEKPSRKFVESVASCFSSKESACKSKTLDSRIHSLNSTRPRTSTFVGPVHAHYPNQVNNFTYESFPFGPSKNDKNLDNKTIKSLTLGGDESNKNSHKKSFLQALLRDQNVSCDSNKISSLNYDIETSKNCDMITLISNNKSIKASLNIEMVKSPDMIRRGFPDIGWRENSKFSRAGFRCSTRSSKKKRKHIDITNSNITSNESRLLSKSSSNLNEASIISNNLNYSSAPSSLITNDVDSNSIKHIKNSTSSIPGAVGFSGNVSDITQKTKSFPEYAKVNKRKNSKPDIIEDPDKARSTSQSPVERAPVIKRISGFGSRCKKESEASFAVNTIKKSESFKGTKIGRRGSITYSVRPKSNKDNEHESFVKTQAIKLRRRESKNTRKSSEYRVSVTIRPSTVATLTNKFNTIILENQAGKDSNATKLPLGHVSVVPKTYTSPRASFRRKYRTKAAAKAAAQRLRENETEKLSKKDPNLRRSKENISKKETSLEQESIIEGTKKEVLNIEIENNGGTSPDVEKKENVTSPSRSQSPKKIYSSVGRTPSLVQKLYINKTDEEKVCEKIQTALSSGKFQGETDDSEDDFNEKKQLEEDNVEDPYISNININMVSSSKVEITCVESEIQNGNKCIVKESHEIPNTPNIMTNVGARDSIKASSSKLTTDKVDVIQLNFSSKESSSAQENHTKSDSMDSGISTGEERLSPNIIIVPGNHTKTVSILSSENDSLLELPKNSEVVYTSKEKSENYFGKIEIINKNQSEMEFNENSEILSDDLSSQKLDIEEESVCSSYLDDTQSEISSVCSENKPKKSGKINESRIYTSLKTVVKNTVKKTKERDAERKECDKEKRNRSPSTDRDSWFRRGRSKERGVNKKKSNTVDSSEEEKSLSLKDDLNDKPEKKKENKLYEKWTFKRFREKSQERKKLKEKEKDVRTKIEDDNIYGAVETKNNELQGNAPNPNDKVKIKSESPDNKWALRSRSRERKRNRNLPLQIIDCTEITNKNTTDSTTNDVTIDLDYNCDHETNYEELTPNGKESSESNSKQKSEGTIFTFDPENIAKTEANSENLWKSKTLPPPPKTPIPSPPHSASSLPPPPTTPIPAVPSEAKSMTLPRPPSVTEKNESSEIKEETNSTENIYENLYAPNMEKLHRNRKKLEGRGIKPNTSFLWSESAKTSTTITTELQNNLIIENLDKKAAPSNIISSDSTSKKDVKTSDDHEQDTYGHNYAELQHNLSSDDSQTISYDDIGAPSNSTISYDDIGAPSSNGYDEIHAPSSVGYDPIRAPSSEGYDPINPPRSDSSQYDDCEGGVVIAQPAVVREDQLDSISYVYDDISMYNASQSSHSYEPINPPGQLISNRTFAIIPELPETEITLTSKALSEKPQEEFQLDLSVKSAETEFLSLSGKNYTCLLNLKFN